MRTGTRTLQTTPPDPSAIFSSATTYGDPPKSRVAPIRSDRYTRLMVRTGSPNIQIGLGKKEDTGT